MLELCVGVDVFLGVVVVFADPGVLVVGGCSCYFKGVVVVNCVIIVCFNFVIVDTAVVYAVIVIAVVIILLLL